MPTKLVQHISYYDNKKNPFTNQKKNQFEKSYSFKKYLVFTKLFGFLKQILKINTSSNPPMFASTNFL